MYTYMIQYFFKRWVGRIHTNFREFNLFEKGRMERKTRRDAKKSSVVFYFLKSKSS